jgi:membrane-bound serine protease (ClpP class)
MGSIGIMQRITSTVWIALLACGGLADELPKEADPVQAAYLRPVRIKIEGVITGLTRETVSRQLERARDDNADLVIVDIDSPGGDAQASMDIAYLLARLPFAHTVAYIDKNAMSGGAFIAIGCKEILMRPDAKIGDAGPIVLGEDSAFRFAPEKIVSFLTAEIRTVANLSGHPPAIAEAMIDKDLKVFFYRHQDTGQTKCMSEAEVANLPKPGDWEKGKQVFGSGRLFLTLDGRYAVETQLADATVGGFDDLRGRYKIEGDIPLFEHTWVDTTVAVLNIPFVTGLLLVLGLVLMYVELFIPGFGIFGILSATCFTLFFWSKFLGGTADWLEVLLFLGGIVCVGVEIFFLPGFAVFGVTGILLILAGLVMAIAPTASQFTNPMDAISTSAATVGSSFLVFVIIGAILARFLGAIPIFSRMALAPPSVDVDHAPAPIEGTVLPTVGPELVGAIGVTSTALRPSGKARINDMELDVVAEGSFIPAGRDVRVLLVQGIRILVREMKA